MVFNRRNANGIFKREQSSIVISHHAVESATTKLRHVGKIKRDRTQWKPLDEDIREPRRVN